MKRTIPRTRTTKDTETSKQTTLPRAHCVIMKLETRLQSEPVIKIAMWSGERYGGREANDTRKVKQEEKNRGGGQERRKRRGSRKEEKEKEKK